MGKIKDSYIRIRCTSENRYCWWAIADHLKITLTDYVTLVANYGVSHPKEIELFLEKQGEQNV